MWAEFFMQDDVPSGTPQCAGRNAIVIAIEAQRQQLTVPHVLICYEVKQTVTTSRLLIDTEQKSHHSVPDLQCTTPS